MKTAGMIALISFTLLLLAAVVIIDVSALMSDQVVSEDRQKFSKIEKVVDTVKSGLTERFPGSNWIKTKGCSQYHSEFQVGDINCEYGILAKNVNVSPTMLSDAIQQILNAPNPEFHKSSDGSSWQYGFDTRAVDKDLSCSLESAYDSVEEKDTVKFSCASEAQRKWYTSANFGE